MLEVELAGRLGPARVRRVDVEVDLGAITALVTTIRLMPIRTMVERTWCLLCAELPAGVVGTGPGPLPRRAACGVDGDVSEMAAVG